MLEFFYCLSDLHKFVYSTIYFLSAVNRLLLFSCGFDINMFSIFDKSVYTRNMLVLLITGEVNLFSYNDEDFDAIIISPQLCVDQKFVCYL